VELGHLALRLAQGSGAGEGLRDGLALLLARQTEIRPVAGLAGLMAATVGFPAPARDAGNRTPAKIPQPPDILHDLNPLFF
jgi:hypothetical protein